MLKRQFTLAALLAVSTAFAAHAFAQDKPLKLGVTAGPHAQIAEAVKQAAAKEGLAIQVIEFSDFIQPNAALVAGDLDANAYQHHPYLDQQVKDRGYKLVPAANTVVLSIALYSKKVESLGDLPQGAQIGLPNDPTNGRQPGAAVARGLIQAGAFIPGKKECYMPLLFYIRCTGINAQALSVAWPARPP